MRPLVVAALAAVGGVVVLAGTQPFASLRLAGVRAPLVVSGAEAVPALTPLGIVLLALALSLTIAGRVARTVLGLLLALVGAGVVAVSLPSVLDPRAGTHAAASTATGVTDVAPLVQAATGTPWGAVAVAAGAVAALIGVFVLLTGRRWPVGGRRYRAAEAPPASTDPIDEWDALSRGADPTTEAAPDRRSGPGSPVG